MVALSSRSLGRWSSGIRIGTLRQNAIVLMSQKKRKNAGSPFNILFSSFHSVLARLTLNDRTQFITTVTTRHLHFCQTPFVIW